MLTDRFENALSLAARLHRTQTRKGSGIPYISHLMAVSALVIEYGGGEDQGGQATADMIRATYGARVADIVLACSDSVQQDKEDWQWCKDRYIASLATKGEDALLVTSCDKLHNATAILTDLREHGPGVFDRFTAKRTGTLWYYRQLADRLTEIRPGPLSDRLAETVAALEAAG